MTQRTTRRINRQAARAAAQATSKGSGSTALVLPAGARTWEPDKAGTYILRIVPYEVKSARHPDFSQGARKGSLWWRMLYSTHRNLGGVRGVTVCPIVHGDGCPACQEEHRLWEQDSKGNKDTIKALRAQRMAMYNVLLPMSQSPDEVVVFDWAYSKFGKLLDNEFTLGDETLLAALDTVEGLVLRVRIIEDSVGDGRTFLCADKIEFLPGKSLADLPDETLDRAFCLEELLPTVTGSDILGLMEGVAPEADTSQGTPNQAPAPTCKACGDTGRNSRGGPCAACGPKEPPQAQGTAQDHASTAQGTTDAQPQGRTRTRARVTSQPTETATPPPEDKKEADRWDDTPGAGGGSNDW